MSIDPKCGLCERPDRTIFLRDPLDLRDCRFMGFFNPDHKDWDTQVLSLESKRVKNRIQQSIGKEKGKAKNIWIFKFRRCMGHKAFLTSKGWTFS